MSHKVLLVDDQITIITYLKAIFQPPEYIVEEAYDGDEAMVKVREFSPDIILLDINMPIMDGFEVCREIRKKPEFAFSKIVLLSGNTTLEDRLEGYEAGANDYVMKPFSGTELKAKVDVLLKLKYSEEVNQLKESFLMLLNHEQNTPLNAILGFSQLLECDDSLSEEQKDNVNQILEAGYELVEKNEKLLKYCELKTTQSIEKTPFKTTLLLGDISKGIKKKLDEKKLKLTFSANDDVTVDVEPILLSTAIKNIIQNAIHFSPTESEVLISSQFVEDCWRIEISNKGKVIPEDQINLIFSPFYNENIWRHKSGMGLSLAMSKLIFELHGGTIAVKNDGDVGVIFTINLPVLSSVD